MFRRLLSGLIVSLLAAAARAEVPLPDLLPSPPRSGISYEAFLKIPADSQATSQSSDSVAEHVAIQRGAPAPSGSATGVLQLLNTTEWRNFTALCAMNGHLYTASPYGVLAFDMTDPATPRLVDKFYHPSPAPGCGRELVGANGFLYLLTPTLGLEVLDATNPASLHVRGTVAINELNPCWTPYSKIMELYDNLVYITSSSDTLFIIDVRNPDAPTVRTAWHDGDAVDIGYTQGLASSMSASDKLLYLSSSYINTPLTTIDVTDPQQPYVCATYWGARDGLPPFGGKLVRSGNYLLGIGPRWPRTEGAPFYLKVMDLTNPRQPQFVCSTLVTNELSDLTAEGNRLYVEAGTTLCTFDITDPCAPRRLACVIVDTALYGGALGVLLAQGGWLYNAGGDDGTGPQPRAFVLASDVANPAAPQTHTVYVGFPGEALAVSESTPLLLLTRYEYGRSIRPASIAQATDPQGGTVISGTGAGGMQRGLDLHGSTLYSAYDCGCWPTGRFAGLDCIDASDPATPYYRWRFNLGQYRHVYFKDVAAAPPYYFLPAEDSGLYVLKEPSPGQMPEQITTLGLPPQARGIAVIGQRAYVVSWGQYLYGSLYSGAYLTVVDISTPASPAIVGYQEPWGQYNIEGWGSRLATTSWNVDHWRVTLYDIDSTGWPEIVGSYDPPDRQGNLRVLKLHGNYLYVKDGEVLDVVDISNPASPVRVDQYTPLWEFWDVAVRGDIVYVSEYDGLKIFRGPACCEGTVGNVNDRGIVDVSDLSYLIAYLTGSGATPLCHGEADLNGSGVVDISDLSFLVEYLTTGGVPLPACP